MRLQATSDPIRTLADLRMFVAGLDDIYLSDDSIVTSNFGALPGLSLRLQVESGNE